MTSPLSSSLRVLIIGSIWPEAMSSAAGLRVWNLIHSWQKRGAAITFAASTDESEHSIRLQNQGVAVHRIRPNDSAFDEWLERNPFEIVVFDRFYLEEQFGWRVRQAQPHAMRILDTEDLHFLRKARQASLQRPEPIDLQTEDSYREIASIYRCDLSLLVSDFEIELLTRSFDVPSRLLSLWSLEYPEPQEPSPSFEERRHFATIGNFRHPPNADGTLWLKREIWPLIRRELPEAEVHIHGAYPPREMMDLSSPREGFFVRGPVPHSIEMLREHRVNLAPLRFGAGVKGKITDGWVAGTPVVTTPIGAEGMMLDPKDFAGGFGGLIARTPAEFAEAAVRIYRDSKEWEEARKKGLLTLTRKFSAGVGSEPALARIEEIRRDITAHRRANYIGQMLHSQTLRSTEYFSRWIELKNRSTS